MFLSRLITFLEEHASPKAVVVLLMAVIPFNALIFPLIGDRLEAVSGCRLLDAGFRYSPEQVFACMSAYGESGRLLHLVTSWSVDFVYPILYAFLFSLLLTLFLRRAFPPASPLIRAQLLPFGMLFFDYLENAVLALLLAIYPAVPAALVHLASLFTSLKWCFAAISFVALLVAIAGLLISFSHGSNPKGTNS